MQSHHLQENLVVVSNEKDRMEAAIKASAGRPRPQLNRTRLGMVRSTQFVSIVLRQMLFIRGFRFFGDRCSRLSRFLRQESARVHFYTPTVAAGGGGSDDPLNIAR